jgi:hypothetical protein
MSFGGFGNVVTLVRNSSNQIAAFLREISEACQALASGSREDASRKRAA